MRKEEDALDTADVLTKIWLQQSVFTHVVRSMQICWNKRKCLDKKRVKIPQDWFGTSTWPPFYCFGIPIWPP